MGWNLHTSIGFYEANPHNGQSWLEEYISELMGENSVTPGGNSRISRKVRGPYAIAVGSGRVVSRPFVPTVCTAGLRSPHCTFCCRCPPGPPLFFSVQLNGGGKEAEKEEEMGHYYLHEFHESEQQLILREVGFSTAELSTVAVVRHEESEDIPHEMSHEEDDNVPGGRNKLLNTCYLEFFFSSRSVLFLEYCRCAFSSQV